MSYHDDESSSHSKTAKHSAFLFYVTVTSMFGGFALTVARARRSFPSELQSHYNEGSKLALKALGYGTLLSVSGCGILVFSVCKLLGVNTAKEFGMKMKEVLPSKDGEFVKKFDNWPTKFPDKPDDGKWKESFK